MIQANRSRFRLSIFVMAAWLLLAVSGCARGDAPSDTADSQDELEALSPGSVLQISPPSASVPATVERQFVATVLSPRSRPRSVSSGVSWKVSDTSIASIDGSGVVTALGPGRVTVMASYQKLSASATLTVTPASLVSVSVAPPQRKIAAGTHAHFHAIGTFSDGTTFPLDGAVTWSSTAQSVATVDANGKATGVAAGETAITATHRVTGLVGKAFLTVDSATLRALAITPPQATVLPGLTEAFVVTGTFSDETTQDLTDTATWSSSNSAVATVSNATVTAGVATGVGAGTATIKAVVGRKSASATITVATAALTAIAVTPAVSSLPNGTTTALVATGTYADNTTRDLTSVVTWSSSAPGVAFVSNASGSRGLVTALSLGTTTITATDATTGLSGSSTLTVTSAVLLGLSLNPPTASVALGLAQAFTATGTFSDSTSRDLTSSVTWSSSSPAVAVVSNDSAAGSAGIASTLSVGSTIVSALDPVTGVTASASLTVTSAVLESLAISPPSASVPNGQSQAFTATGTYSDGSTQVITAAVTWSSSGPSATVSNAQGSIGLATAVSTGTATITAVDPSTGVQGTATLTTTAAALESIQVLLQAFGIQVGQTLQLKATGTYGDGSTLDLTQAVTWSSSDATVTSISNATGNAGIVMGIGAGAATISATDPATGIAGNASVTVSAIGAFAVVQSTIGSEGGQISADGAAVLTVPAGAVSSPTVFAALRVSSEPIYDFEPHGLTFAVPPTLALDYAGADLAGADPTTLSVGWFDSGTWNPLPSMVRTDTQTLSAQLPHFSLFGPVGVYGGCSPYCTNSASPAVPCYTTQGLTYCPNATFGAGAASIAVVPVTISVAFSLDLGSTIALDLGESAFANSGYQLSLATTGVDGSAQSNALYPFGADSSVTEDTDSQTSQVNSVFGASLTAPVQTFKLNFAPGSVTTFSPLKLAIDGIAADGTKFCLVRRSGDVARYDCSGTDCDFATLSQSAASLLFVAGEGCGPVECVNGGMPCAPGCIDAQTDNANCGACGHACTGNLTCSSGVCCAPGQAVCNGACVDLQSDPKNCGACGTACTSNACSNASCCPLGYTACADGCVDLQNDANNCGTCGNPCLNGQTCCGGSCTDTSTDPNNCGTCALACASGNACATGSCCGSCPTTCSVWVPLATNTAVVGCGPVPTSNNGEYSLCTTSSDCQSPQVCENCGSVGAANIELGPVGLPCNLSYVVDNQSAADGLQICAKPVTQSTSCNPPCGPSFACVNVSGATCEPKSTQCPSPGCRTGTTCVLVSGKSQCLAND
jgi:uncharacterized protein YjdB